MKRIYTPAKKKTILIVDDDQIFLRIFREKFLCRGYNVETASDAATALHKLDGISIDLVLLDLSLPGINAVEVLRNIRAQFPNETLPIIAFSNPYLINLARAALEAGASKCIPKIDAAPDHVLELARALLAPGPVVPDDFSGTPATQIPPAFLEELVRIFLNSAPAILAKLRAGHQNFARTEVDEARQAELLGMHRQVHALAIAGLLGLRKISLMTSALEALLIELHAKPHKITPSVIRTVAQALDRLVSLFEHASDSPTDEPATPKILVVDDEIISRETICAALTKANLNAVSLDDSLAAQQTLQQEHFDLIFLDVEMPGQNGFELCVKIREMETNRTTPVVFVTAHSDFGSRAQSALSGGNDFIAKPFLSVELVVKTLTRLLKESPRPPANMTAQFVGLGEARLPESQRPLAAAQH